MVYGTTAKRIDKEKVRKSQLQEALDYCKKNKCGGTEAMATKRFPLLWKTAKNPINRYLRDDDYTKRERSS